MAHTSRKFSVKTALGTEVGVACPICHRDEFVSVRSHAAEDGDRFQHVTVGQIVQDGKASQAVAMPIRFQACANCGYILKFLLERA